MAAASAGFVVMVLGGCTAAPVPTPPPVTVFATVTATPTPTPEPPGIVFGYAGPADTLLAEGLARIRAAVLAAT